MSKITQIERELLVVNDSIFHRLCSAFIHYKFNYNVTDKGLVKGKDKPVKGTPDSYILDNGKTLFVEITTQEKGVYEKFKKDIDKCSDFLKKGIVIEKIFLCYNYRFDVTEKNKLFDLGIKNNIQIEIITLDELKYELHRPFGFLAKEFLGVDIDSGQILEIDRYIYENDKKTTSLQNLFVSRKTELGNINDIIEQRQIVILSGNPGTGKTRLAIEAAQKYKEKEPLLKTYVITNKGQSIYNDLQSYFLPNNDYIVIIDDANRIGDLNRIIELSLLDELSIQIIITVRDYALNKVIQQFRDIDKICFQTIKVEKLTSKEIEEILYSQKITNPICIRKITYISNGNPRLAMMASEHALETNNCYALNNVTDIYNKYFSKFIGEIEELKNKDLLITLGIISFNRNLNKENVEFNKKTFEVFKISENDFWENVFILHDLELVDLYEKQIVKISDQIIAEYFFYYIFIKENIIDFSFILNTYIENYSGKIRDNLYPVLNNFDQFRIMGILKDSVDNFYESIKTNDDLVYKFFEIFWFDRKTELLIWLQERIEQIELKTDFDFKFTEPKDFFNSQNYPFLELLKLFGHQPDEDFVISLEILFSYVYREPSILPDVVKYFNEDLAFKTQSYEQNYFIQVRLFDYLFNKASNGFNTNFYKKLILEISEKFLHIYFEDTKSEVRNKNTFVISQVYIYPTDNIKKLRSKIWEFLLIEFYNFEEKSFKILSNYINQSFTSIFQFEERNKKDTPAKQVAKFDKKYVLKFFESVLRNDNYLHCKLFDSFLDRFESDKLDYSHLKERFTNRVYEVSLILKWDFIKLKKNHEIEFREDLKGFKKKEIQIYFKDYKFEDYIQLIEDISFLLTVEENHALGFRNSFEIILLHLLKSNDKLLFKVLGKLFSNNNKINFISRQIVFDLLNNSRFDINEIYSLLNSNEYKLKSIWKQNFFICIKEEIINDFFFNELIKMYENWDNNLNVEFEYWNKFKKYDNNIFNTIFAMLLIKTKISEFSFDFNYWTLFEQYESEFENDSKLLASIYKYKDKTEDYFDFDRKYLNKLVKIDNEFLFEIIKIKYSHKDIISSRHENYRFDFIWDYSNYEYLLEKSFEILADKYSIANNIINIFFPVNINDKIIDFIRKFIIKYHADIKNLKKIFNVITYTYPSQRIYFLSLLIKQTIDFEIIKSLELIQSYKSGGSLIPLYEADKKFWQEFEILLSKNVKHLKLKSWTKQKQLGCERDIEWNRKREFVDDF